MAVARRPRNRLFWQRMEAIGLEYMGPEYPAGRRADPRPSHLPQGHEERADVFVGTSLQTLRTYNWITYSRHAASTTASRCAP